jgi:putative protease
MTLINGSERLTLRFDCKACEMHVVGRMRKSILKSPPPTTEPAAVTVSFHRRGPAGARR